MTEKEQIIKIQDEVKAGTIDLRMIGMALGTGFDQDFPARLLVLARIGANVAALPRELYSSIAEVVES